MIKLSDSALIKRIKEGDETAFEYLLQRYEPLITKIARKYYMRTYEKEDFYQIGAAAFYKAVLNFEEKEDSTFYSYALSCVRNKIVSQCRKHLTKVEYITDYEDFTTVMEAHEMYTVEKSVLLDEVNDTLLHAYRTELTKLHQFLSPLEKKILESFVQGFSYTEIAEIHGIEIKKVDNALMRIRAKVRERIFEE